MLIRRQPCLLPPCRRYIDRQTPAPTKNDSHGVMRPFIFSLPAEPSLHETFEYIRPLAAFHNNMVINTLRLPRDRLFTPLPPSRQPSLIDICFFSSSLLPYEYSRLNTTCLFHLLIFISGTNIIGIMTRQETLHRHGRHTYSSSLRMSLRTYAIFFNIAFSITTFSSLMHAGCRRCFSHLRRLL